MTASERAAVRVVGFDSLSGHELDGWHALRAANPSLDSPYFHPGFAAAVHASGAAVRVVVVRDALGGIVALLPVHRERSLVRPVGWPAADFQGPVLAPGTAFSPLAMLTDGVRGFAFDHLPDTMPGFEPWIESRRPSPFLDVSGGMTGYLGRASRSGKDNMAQARRRTRKAEREHGPVRFVADTVHGGLLDEVVRLKREQYAATGARDYFAEPDRRALAHRLLNTRGTDFAGMLSAVYAGEHLLAAHFGLRSGGVLHWWFPVYEPRFGHLTPGWLLLRELVCAAPELGIDRIDLGRGEDEYKRRAKTGETTVCQGLVSRSRALITLRGMRNSAITAAKSSPLAPSLRSVARTFRVTPK